MNAFRVRKCACGCGSTNVAAHSLIIGWAIDAGIPMPNARNKRGYLTPHCARRIQQQLLQMKQK